jgi:RNA polymerase sigma-70 factor (ECF subfamily)
MDFEIVTPASSQTPGMKRKLQPPGEPGAPPSEVIGALYADAYDMVWSILGRAGISRKEVRSELAHDVFVVALEVHAKRNRKSPPRKWLAAITWNVVSNHRARQREKREETVDDLEPVSTDASPEATAIRRRYLRDCYEGMEHERQVVFDMHEVEGFSVPEIAHALDIPPGTVATRLRLAREHVKAVHARLEAAAARAEGRSRVLPALLPFGPGAWRALGRSFEDDAASMRPQVWRAIVRTLTARAALGSPTGAASGGVAGKTVVALLALGAVIGGSVVFIAMSLYRPPSAASPPEVSIGGEPDVGTRAPEAATPSAPPSATPPAFAMRAGAGAGTSATVAAPPGATTGTAAKLIDPEEAALIENAQAAFAQEDLDAARGLLRDHASRFPHGRLAGTRTTLLAQMDQDAGAASLSRSSAPSTPDGGP